MKLSAMKSFNTFASGDAPLDKQSTPIGLAWLEVKLPLEELTEDDYLQTMGGDSLLNQFYNGNWSTSVQTMRDHYVRWDDLLKFQSESELWGDFEWFDKAFYGELGFALGRTI